MGNISVCGLAERGMTEEGGLEQRDRGLEVVDDPADGLDVGSLGLPLVVAAVVSSLNDIHTATEVRLLIHHPASHRKHIIIELLS